MLYVMCIVLRYQHQCHISAVLRPTARTVKACLLKVRQRNPKCVVIEEVLWLARVLHGLSHLKQFANQAAGRTEPLPTTKTNTLN